MPLPSESQASVQHFVRSSPDEPSLYDDSRPPPPPGFGLNDKKPDLKIDKIDESLAPVDSNLLKSPLVVEPAGKRSGQPEEPFPPPPLHQSKVAAYESKRAESNGRSAEDVGDTIFIGELGV